MLDELEVLAGCGGACQQNKKNAHAGVRTQDLCVISTTLYQTELHELVGCTSALCLSVDEVTAAWSRTLLRYQWWPAR